VVKEEDRIVISLAPDLVLSDEHVYTHLGARVPGVTSVLAAERLIDARFFTAESRIRGTAVHAAVEQDEREILDEAFLDPRIGGYLEGWRAFKRDSGYVTATLPILGGLALMAEVRMCSLSMGVAGTADGIGTMRGVHGLALIDVKSGEPSPATSLQTAAYASMFHEHTGIVASMRFAVQLTAEGNYRIHKYADLNDIFAFRAALGVHRWRQRNLPALAEHLEAA
jgi:hypothetical protein